MAQYCGLRSLHRDIKIRVQDALSGLPVQLSTQVDTMIDLDLSYNRLNLYHHSAIGQFIPTALNNTITAQSGTATGPPVVISGALTTLYTNVVAGGPNLPGPS